MIINGNMTQLLEQESPLPLKDPHDAVAQCMLNIQYHIIW